MSDRNTLKHRVECMTHSYYEVIAAFNSEEIAITYAKRNAELATYYTYRVMTLRGNKWKQVWPVQP